MRNTTHAKTSELCFCQSKNHTGWRKEETCIPSAVFNKKPFNRKFHFYTHFNDYEIEAKRNQELHEGHTTSREARVKTCAVYLQNLPLLTSKLSHISS